MSKTVTELSLWYKKCFYVKYVYVWCIFSLSLTKQVRHWCKLVHILLFKEFFFMKNRICILIFSISWQTWFLRLICLQHEKNNFIHILYCLFFVWIFFCLFICVSLSYLLIYFQFVFLSVFLFVKYFPSMDSLFLMSVQNTPAHSKISKMNNLIKPGYFIPDPETNAIITPQFAVYEDFIK